MPTRSLFTYWFRLLRYAHRLFGGLFLFILFFVLINTYVFTISQVNGHSMEPSLSNGKFVPVCLACTLFQKPKLGDIVIVQYQGVDTVYFIKRIEGVPGNTVQYNGTPYTLKSNEYFVVGDNRSHSTDSRVYGPIQANQIKGIVLGTYGTDPGPAY